MGKIRINDLARELEIKSKAILACLTELGITEKRSHSSPLDDDIADRVRQYFRPTAEERESVRVLTNPAKRILQPCPQCGAPVREDHMKHHLQRVHKKKQNISRKTKKKRHLRELRIRAKGRLGLPIRWGYPDCGVILGGPEISNAQATERLRKHRQEVHNKGPSQASRSGHPLLTCPECRVPVREDRLERHLRRMHGWDIVQAAGMLEALLRDRRGASVESAKRKGLEDSQTKVDRLPFELLPPGTWDIEHVIAYYREAASRFPSDLAGREIEWARLQKLNSLRPAKCYVGKESWLGYVVFEFSWSRRVILECPIKGNATYVLWGDWKKMVPHTKLHLRTTFPHNYTRIVHKGAWLTRGKAAL